VPLRHELANDRDELRVRAHLSDVLDVDAADGAERTPSLPRRSVRARQAIQSNDRTRVLLAARREDGTERHVVRTSSERALELGEVVGGHADEQARRHASCFVDLEILLPHVDAITAGEERQVGSVVGEQLGSPGVTDWQEPAQEVQGVTRGGSFGTQLDDCGPRVNQLFRESQGLDPCGSERIDVHNRVKTAHLGEDHRSGRRTSVTMRPLVEHWAPLR